MDYRWLMVFLGIAILIPLYILGIKFRNKSLKISNQFFQAQVNKRNGTLNKGISLGVNFQPGFNFQHQKFSIKVYMVARGIILEVQFTLNNEPALLMGKVIPSLGFLFYSPGKKKILFNSPFDQGYTTQGKEEEWIRNIFSDKIQDGMLKSNIGRLSINKNKLTAQFRVLKLKDIGEIDQSIDVCLEIIDRIAESSSIVS